MNEVSCRITAAFIQYIRNTGNDFINPLIEGLPFDEKYLSNPDNWIPLEIERILEDRLVQLFDDDAIMFRIGRSVVALKSLGTVNILFNLFITPERLIRYAPRIARYFTKDIVHINVLETSKNSAVVELRVKGRQTRGACLFNQGMFSLASELFGQGETVVTEVQCVVPVQELGRMKTKSCPSDDQGILHEYAYRYSGEKVVFGAESCIYKLTWKNKAFTFSGRIAGRKKALEEALGHLEENYAKLQNAYEGLQKSEEKYRDLMENASDIICLLDTNGAVTALNKKGVELSGYTTEEVLKQDFLIFIDDADREKVSSKIKESLEGATSVFDVLFKGKNGRRLILSVNSTPVRVESAISGIMIIARDITKEREIAGRLLEAERFAAKGMIAAEIAHEINNSLANIETALFILNKIRIDREYRQDILKDVYEEIGRMSGIVKGILEVYRSDSSVIQTVSINEEITKILNITQRRLKGRGISIISELLPGLSSISCYPGHIKQILMNLIKNAEEAMVSVDKRMIVISTEEDGSFVKLRVADTGCGIPEEKREKLFSPFYTTKPEGSGIGLLICREIVQRYKGDIEIISSEGKGTVVIASFPKE